MNLLLAWLAPALASGLLYSDARLEPLGNLDADVLVDGRIATATCTYTFPDAWGGEQTFAAHLPVDAAVAGLRFRVDDGPWIAATAHPAGELDPDEGPMGDPGELWEGQLFATSLPTHSRGELVVELVWQRVLAADSGALAVAVPLDDGGLNPGEPEATVRVRLEAALDLVEVDFPEQGEVVVDGAIAEAEWGGQLSDLHEVGLEWVEEPADLGILAYTYRPAVDPFTGVEADAGYALVVLQPGETDPDARVDQLFTFVLDTSASMQGEPLDAAVAAGAEWLAELESDDRFNAVTYASQPVPFRGRAPHATPEVVERAIAFLERQRPLGLSDPGEALVLALVLADDTVQQRTFFGCSGSARGEAGDAPPVPGRPVVTDRGRATRVAPYVVLLTDGGATTGETDPDLIAWEVAAANAVGASLFAIGVGEDVDRALLDRLTAAHRGEARYALDVEEVPAAVAELRDRIQDPLLVQPRVEVDAAMDQAPAALPDATAGHEVVVAFRWERSGPAEVRLQAIRGQDDLDRSYPVDLPEEDEALPAVARAWAQLRVADLDAAWLAGDTSVYSEIEQLVLTWGVSSQVVTLGFDHGPADTGAPTQATADHLDGTAGCGCGPGAPPALAWAPLGLGFAAALGRRRRQG